jgi:hypothetical protein
MTINLVPDEAFKRVVIAPLDKNPAGDGVYFVKGDPTEPADLDETGTGG